MIDERLLDALDGCALDKRRESTSYERLWELLGERRGEPEPAESEGERELRHRAC